MSLVSLSSESSVISNYNQSSFNFKNHFPQPIILKSHSQVCLSSITFSGFVGNEYNITGSSDPTIFTGSNKLLFGFDDAEFTGDYDVAILRIGVYTGANLAVEIARALNEANRLRHFQFSVSFTEGNLAANPITFDEFEISYAAGDIAVYGEGNWTKAARIVQDNLTITTVANHSGTFPNPATAIQIADVVSGDPDYQYDYATAFSWQKGLAQYVPVDGHGGGSAHFTFYSDDDGVDYSSTPVIATCRVGLARPSRCGGGLQGIKNTSAQFLFGSTVDIQVQSHYNELANKNALSILLQARFAGEPVWDSDRSVIGRVIDLDNILVTKQDVLVVKITPFFPTGDYIVQLYRSRDRGETYTLLADGVGGNNTGTDTDPKVYTEDMGNNFTPFEGCIYTTRNAFGNTPRQYNAYDPSTVTMIPFVSFPRKSAYFFPPNKPPQGYHDQNIIVSLDLTSDTTDAPCQATLNTDAGTLPPRVADNVYTIQFDSDTTNGYLGTIGITTPETGLPVSGVPSTELDGKAFAKDPTNRGFTRWLIYDDNSIDIATATSTGTMELVPAANTLTISGSFFSSGEDWVGVLDGGANGKPTTTTVPYMIFTQSMENTEDSVMYRFRNDFGIGKLSENAYSLVYDTLPTVSHQFCTVNLDYSIDNASRFITGQITQRDVNADGDGAMRRLRVGTGRVATVQDVLGFKNTSYELISGTTTLTSDAQPLKELPIGEKQIHVSIPELSNVKSLEGESSQRYKTIKVLPKTVFTKSEEDGVVSYSANYEDWIDINNLAENQINELTMQLRNADGKLAKFVDGTTRATVKFREDPEKKQERMFDRLARQITQSQNPGQEILVNRGSFVGS